MCKKFKNIKNTVSTSIKPYGVFQIVTAGISTSKNSHAVTIRVIKKVLLLKENYYKEK